MIFLCQFLSVMGWSAMCCPVTVGGAATGGGADVDVAISNTSYRSNREKTRDRGPLGVSRTGLPVFVTLSTWILLVCILVD